MVLSTSSIGIFFVGNFHIIRAQALEQFPQSQISAIVEDDIHSEISSSTYLKDQAHMTWIPDRKSEWIIHGTDHWD